MTGAAPTPGARPGRWSRPLIGPFSLAHVVVLLVVLGTASGLLLLLTTPVANPAATPAPVPGTDFYRLGDATSGVGIGQAAPELTGVSDGKQVELTDLDGRPIRLADLRGHPVWLSFWASWCPPCQSETPVVRDLYDAHRDQGLAVVAVSVQETSPADVRRYAETYGLDYTIGFDATSAVFRTYQGYGLPTHYFINRDGVVRERHYGPLTVAEAEHILAPLLAPSGSPAVAGRSASSAGSRRPEVPASPTGAATSAGGG
jgi:cytochrome c biogenesis protein CcmG/thiol:disulfide interchange protein DsbE